MPKQKPRATEFGAALTAHRQARGWTLEYLAGLLNDVGETTTHTKNTVGRWERGDHGLPSPKNQRLLAKVFGISVAELPEPPKPVSIDKMLSGYPTDIWMRVAQMTELFLGTQAAPGERDSKVAGEVGPVPQAKRRSE